MMRLGCFGAQRRCVASLVVVFVGLCLPSLVSSLSAVSDVSKGRLRDALSSLSGKLTLSPEIVIPEPTDPTAILLQSNAIKVLSERIRTQAKANSAWLAGSPTSVQTFCTEQEDSRGNFPGPVPVVYCGSETNVEALAGTGIEGMLVQANNGEPLESIESLQDDTNLQSIFQAATESGIVPIPEIVIGDSTAASWDEETTQRLVDTLESALGDEPACLLITINPDGSADEDDEEDEKQVSLPRVSKPLSKRLPIVGSVRAKAGDNRMGVETERFKEAGFTGTVLRSDCVPGFRMNPDLDLVGRFWGACIGDLKSTKSKSFQFQTRNYLDKSVPLEWARYQKDVLDSGALGEAEDNIPVDMANGDYQGF